ncbi:sulfotransferase domain-containing protein [Anaerolineales bacterium HSG25]|nr:sulfotransferase domain-containing protein [Anaerolineales bacterium HSG25]
MKQLRALLRKTLPDPAKRAFWSTVKQFRLYTGVWRLLPDFIIIGGQRCGTTTLYKYLIQHPYIMPASGKELHFFDLNFEKGQTWYQTHFPTRAYKQLLMKTGRQPLITGESSPYYLFHPHVPSRVATMRPSAKLIVLLRNPIDRAYSHYFHEVRWGFETASTFEQAISLEPERLAGEADRLLENEHYYSFSHHHHTYLERGIYVDQLEYWSRFFPKEQLLILSSENFYTNTPTVFKQILQFLELPIWEPPRYKNFNQANNPNIDPEIRTRLQTYFQPHNDRLYDYLGRNFDWR